jgi:hypothetical protein
MKSFNEWLKEKLNEVESPYLKNYRNTVVEPYNKHDPNTILDINNMYKQISRNPFSDESFKFMQNIVKGIGYKKLDYEEYKPYILDFFRRLQSQRPFHIDKNQVFNLFLKYFENWLPTLRLDNDVDLEINKLLNIIAPVSRY